MIWVDKCEELTKEIDRLQDRNSAMAVEWAAQVEKMRLEKDHVKKENDALREAVNDCIEYARNFEGNGVQVLRNRHGHLLGAKGDGG